MPASLCIHVHSIVTETSQEIPFFEAADWNMETEKQLLLKMQEIFAATRIAGKSLDLRINIATSAFSEMIFLLKKKAHTEVQVNHQKLSLREIEILGLVMQGFTNNEISEKLFISYETVKTHRKNILEKTGAKNTIALINYYHQTFFEK